MVSYQINVYGRVQGVGFRWFTQTAAEQYHLVGWVRNQLDGSVAMVVQGELRDVTEFLAIVAEGPGPYSRVDRIEKKPIAPFKGNNFTIQ
ncbi:acylphosphatase [Leuconostoc holzapfelii]|uniref:Acylphosphatase n=1 Tax=Leuconostoc holzapfelii TaxID=434464 RepID=A0ABT2NTF0_9LACO|nr:acylphosphatase [Leuconostoc holzapfelii]MCT8388649.1 acylphosphatase [Leuconostoc holzapfelii]